MYDASAPDTGPAPMPDSGAGDGGVEDTCDNGLDDDRDGRVDEECQCTPGRDQACYGGDPALAGIGGCSWGAQRRSCEIEDPWHEKTCGAPREGWACPGASGLVSSISTL